MSLRKNLLVLVCVLLTGCDLAIPPQSQQLNTHASPLPQSTIPQSSQAKDIVGDVIWSGESGGVRVVWTTSDLYRRSASETESIWAPLVQKGFEDFVAVVIGDKPEMHNSERCRYERTFKVLSVVGAVVSFEDQYKDDCGGAHPSADTRFTTIDLSKPGEVRYAREEDSPMMNVDLAKLGKVSRLSDYFSERDILQALTAEPNIQKAIDALDHKRSPQSLAELPQLFASDDYALGDSDFELRPDFLTRFAFHHVEGDRVAIRIGLPPQSGANRTRHKELEIFLPAPESLREQLKLAASRQQGFLMSDANQIRRGQLTIFRLRTDATATGRN